MISDSLCQLIQSGVSTIVGTRDADLTPECMRAVGAQVHADRRHLTVFLPVATARRSVANLRDNGEIAVSVSEVTTHRTRQIKGRVVSIRDATDVDRATIEKYVEAFVAEIMVVGLSPGVSRRLSYFPAHVVELEVTEVFDQTPGPGAGAPLRRGEA